MVKIPLLVEIIGEAGVGKTHLGCLFPNPIILDTTPKGEALPVVRKLHPKDWKKRWVPIRTLTDLKQTIEMIISKKEFKTVVVDTSANLQDLSKKEWLKRHSGREKPLPFEYVEIREPIDELVSRITKDAMINLVMTSQMKDEYGPDGKKTGRRIRDGYVKLPFMADIRLYIELKQIPYVEGGMTKYKYERIVHVIKNRFRDPANPNEWISRIKPTWEDIVKLTGLEEEDLVA